MWPLPNIENEFVGIVCTPTALTYSHIERKNNHYCLTAFDRVALEHGELDDLVIHNPTLIKKHTETFLQRNKLTNAFIAVACSGPTVQEHIVTVPTATPTRTTLQIPELKKCVWDYCYLYPKEPDHLFYACGMHREHLAQYQLLFGATHLNLTMVTTTFMATLHAYTLTQGATFRHSQLAHDMGLYGTHLEKSITSTVLERHIRILPSARVQESDYAALVASLGLFLSGFEQ